MVYNVIILTHYIYIYIYIYIYTHRKHVSPESILLYYKPYYIIRYIYIYIYAKYCTLSFIIYNNT